MEIKKNEKTEKNLVEMEIAVSGEEFEKAVEQSYRKNVKHMNIPGFRKGKAPRKMIEKLYGESVFYDDAVNSTYPEAYYEAVTQAGIEPVSEPEININDINSEGYIFTAKITVRPEVKLGQYKGLKAVKEDASVSDEEVEKEIDRMAERVSKLVPVENRPVQDGDSVVLDFEGFIDGVPFEGGKGENFTLKIGSHQFIDNFEEQLIGTELNGEKEVNVTFPEDYQAAELAGKQASFKCLIHEIDEPVKPEIDDEFVKDVSEFDTLEELRADIRKYLEDTKGMSSRAAFEESLMDQIVASMEAEIPEVMFKNEVNTMIEDFSRRVAMQGIDFDTYLKMNKMEMSSVEKLFEPQAERQVKTRLALEEISRLEGINPTEQEIEEEYKKIAEQYKMELERVKEIVPEEGVEGDLKLKKAVDIVCDSAEIEEK